MSIQPIRPTATADHRRKARKQAEKDAEMFGMKVDGVEYTLNPNDLTGAVEFRIRERLGMGLAELSEKVQASPGFDYIGMFLWACRVAKGETDLDLMEVLEGISAGSEIDEIEVKPAPKASAKNS